MPSHSEIPVAVVTGATSAIGQAICRQLVVDGYDVVIHYNQQQSVARELQEEIAHQGRTATIVSADLGKPAGIDRLLTSVSAYVGDNSSRTLRVLVNNAALVLGPGFGEVELDDFDRYSAVNLRSPFFLTQELSKRMPSGGSIVNISSAAAHFSSPGDIVYALTKSAIESLTLHAAERLAESNIRINTVVPGFTDNGHPLFRDSRVRSHLSFFAALGGVAEPSAVSDAVSFLVSDRAARTTGTSIDVSGGSTLGFARQTSKTSLRELDNRVGSTDL